MKLVLRERSAKWSPKFDQNRLSVPIEPKPIAVYLQNVKCGHIGAIRIELKCSFSSLAHLNISFVGETILQKSYQPAI